MMPVQDGGMVAETRNLCPNDITCLTTPCVMMKTILTPCALWAIRAYQRHLSPRKGYGCAYRLLYGGSGCSGVAYRLVRRYGVFKAWLVLQRRFAHCRAAQAALRQQRFHAGAAHQRGECDAGCVDLDCGDVDCRPKSWWHGLDDWLDCCDVGGDGDKKDAKKRQYQQP